MAFCGKCGSPVSEGMSFCGKCGAPINIPANVPPIPPAGGGPATGLTSNVAAALSYLLGFITGILFLVLDPYKNDRFVRFHAFQSIFFSIAVTALWIVTTNLFFFGFGFGFLFGVWSVVQALISLALLLYWIFLMYKAYSSERYKIPVLGEIAEKQAG